MLSTLPEMSGATTLEEMREKLADFLGLETPVPLPVVRRAVVDANYTRYLVTSRHQPRLLDLLFRDPRNQGFEDAESAVPSLSPATDAADTAGASDAAGVPAERSSLKLALKAGAAVARWSRTGFSRVEPEVFEKRFAACQACPHLAAPPDKLIYKIRLGQASDPRVCGACGCVASRKAHLPTESCPVAHPDDATLNRWGEPRPARQQ